MTEAYAIKPCPCCGWDARFEEVTEGQQNSGGIYIECTNELCRLSTNLMFPLMDDVRPELAQKWNRRVPVTVSEKGEAEMLPDFIRKRIERSCDEAEHPAGMSVHDGVARIHASDIRRLLAIIDAYLSRGQG